MRSVENMCLLTTFYNSCTKCTHQIVHEGIHSKLTYHRH